MMNSSTQKLQPPSPEVSIFISSWLFLWETIWMQETTHDSKITNPTNPPPTPSVSCDTGAIPFTSNIFNTRGTCHTPKTCRTQSTPDTQGTSNACGTRDNSD